MDLERSGLLGRSQSGLRVVLEKRRVWEGHWVLVGDVHFDVGIMRGRVCESFDVWVRVRASKLAAELC